MQVVDCFSTPWRGVSQADGLRRVACLFLWVDMMTLSASDALLNVSDLSQART
jgi:hypothetical protein